MPFYGRRKMRMVAVKPASARKYKPARKKYSKAPKATFTAKVQKIIASNVENKYTASVDYRADVSAVLRTRDVAGNLTTSAVHYVWAPGSSLSAGMFNIAQGTNIQQRIGNKIKIKRWIIKGMIQPNPTFDQAAAITPVVPGNSSGISQNSFCGYVDLYFGRRMDNLQPVGNDLNKFYQNGATDITPIGNLQELLYPVNKDLYKVYFHKRFKVGAGNGFSGSGPTLAYDPQPLVPGANGFGLTKSFGFDVCKYICKNKVISFDESDTTPQYDNIENLCIWALFHPAAGDMSFEVPGPVSGSSSTSTNKSFYQISAVSYAEYEDA